MTNEERERLERRCKALEEDGALFGLTPAEETELRETERRLMESIPTRATRDFGPNLYF